MRPLLWSLLNLTQAILASLWSAFCITAALAVLLVTWRRQLPLAMARTMWAPVFLRLALVRLEVVGRQRIDPRQPCVFVANHQSLIDIPVAFAALPSNLHFVVKRELKWIPFVGWYIAAMGMIFVDRRERLGALASVRRAGELIRGGRSVIAFPEGTRSRDGTVAAFKAGSLIPAIEAGVPVVPVAIQGAAAVLPADGIRARPGTIRVIIGEPIATSDLELDQRRQLASEARDRVLALLENTTDRAPNNGSEP
jgi:1-acyl-sn-glycerol-3-phosphate acyltransferase